MVTALLFILMLLVLIIPHEWGHMIVAKLCGVKVNEFSVGMGPLILKKQKGETQYSVRLLPLGGFCAMEGEEESSDDPRSYSSKSNLQKVAILLAGVTMNIIIAILVVSITVGIAGVPSTTLESVTVGMPAYEAGIRNGDKIISIDGMKTSRWEDVTTAIDSYDASKNIQVEVRYLRDGEEMVAQLVPEYNEEMEVYLIGITAALSKNPLLCLSYGAETTWKLVRLMFDAIKTMFANGIGRNDVAGPIGLVKIVNQTASVGIEPYLMLLALVSLNLALFNIIPIPGLDGGKIFFILLKIISRGKITDDMETKATMVGMFLLISFAILITINDVRNLF